MMVKTRLRMGRDHARKTLKTTANEEKYRRDNI